MLQRWCLAAIFFLIFFVSVNSTQTKMRKEKGVDFVDLNEKDTDEIVMKWNEQAISGVMAAVASKNAKYLTKDELKDLESCSKNANTIEKHAECIMPALNAKVYRKEYNKNFQNSQDLIKKLVPSKFLSDGSAEAPESLKTSREMPQTKKMPKPNSTSLAQISSPKSIRKFRTDRIQQRKSSNFRFPQAKRINSAKINWQKFLPKNYRMAKYSTQKIGKKPYRKHFFTAKFLDYRNRLPKLWHTSREKYISKRKEEYYYQQKKVGSFILDQRRRRKRYVQKSASSVYSINDSQRKLTPIGLFAKFFMDDIIAKRNKTARVPWQNMVEKAKKTAVKKKEMKKRMRMMEQTPLEEMAFKFLDRNGSPPRFGTPPTVLYLDGEIFDFIFAKNIGENFDENVFALVSAVEKSNTFTSEGCQMNQFNSTSTVFTNIDYTNGYHSYQHCEHIINIPLNHEGNIGLMETNYEACCDSLTIVENKSNTTHEWNVSNLRKHFSIKSNANGSRITFTSDGNVQEAGYKAVLKIYECVCGNKEYIVECNNSIRITPLNGNIDYCDNMNCTYQIFSNCPNNYFRLDPYIDSLRPEYDQLLLLNNGKVVENYTNKDYINGYEIFLYNNNFTLTFNSGISNENISYEKLWHLDFIPIYPVITKVLLDTDIPNHAIWIANIKENDAYSVCTKFGILEMFITDGKDNIKLRGFLLYDNDGLQNYVGRLSSALNSTSNSLPRSLKSKSGCFTIYNTQNYDYLYYSNHTILFKTIDESISNCGNNFTVFQVSSPDFIIINTTNSGPCKASFLTDNTYSKSFPYIWIEQMYTSATQKIIFISEMNNKKFLNISLNDRYKWADFVMFTPALSIVIPASTYLIIKFSTEHKTISMQPQKLIKGIFASPSYFGIFDTFEMLEFPIVISPFTEVLVKVMHGTPDVVINETQNNTATNYTLTSSEHLLIYGQFQLIYAGKNPSKNNFLIEYTLQESGPATSTSVLTTTTPTTTNAATSFISLTSESVTTSLPNNSVATTTPKMTTLSSAKTSTDSATTIQNHNFAAIEKPGIFINFYTVLSYVFYYLLF